MNWFGFWIESENRNFPFEKSIIKCVWQRKDAICHWHLLGYELLALHLNRKKWNDELESNTDTNEHKISYGKNLLCECRIKIIICWWYKMDTISLKIATR